MTDHPVTTPEPWPDWLADLTPEDRVRAIADAVAECYGDHQCQGKADHFRESAGGQHCTVGVAGDLLSRLLDEARQQGWESAFTDAVDVQQKRLDAAFGVGRRAERNGAVDPGDLRERIDVALGESMDRCARCKVCDAQLDAIMAVLAAEPAPVPPADPKATLSLLRSQVTAALDRAFDGDGTDPADAVMAVVSPVVRGIWAEARGGPRTQAEVLPASLATDRLTVAVAALTRLMLDEPLTELRDDDDRARLISRELTARMQYAAGTLETIGKLGDEAPEPATEPLTHFTTAGESRLAADK